MQAKDHALSLIVFAAILSGISGILVKFMDIPATSMAWLRMGTPTVIMGAYLWYKGSSILKPGYKTIMMAGGLNVLRMLFFFLAYIYTSVSNAIIVLYTWPIFAVILSIIFLKEKVSKKQLFALLLSFVGILIVYTGHDISIENSDFIGLTCGIICAFLYACSVIIFKSKSKSFNPFETIFFQNFLGLFIFLPFFFIDLPKTSLQDISIGLTHGVMIGVVMFTAFFYGLKYVKASTASMITYIEIISAITLGHLILGERLTSNMILGAAIIIGATLLLQNKKIKEVEVAEPVNVSVDE